jgi:hypothetical protein
MAQFFDDLRERLLRAGVAPRHVRRYLRELRDHFADLMQEEQRAGRNRAAAESAATERLGSVDDLARAMIEQRQFRSWCTRAPWAMFVPAPLVLLAVAYFAACFILWSGWKIFMPHAVTPFGGLVPGPIYGLENSYFQTGRMIYFGAPIFIGWGIGVIAARQRLKVAWPAIGLALIALIGSAARVHAIRPAPSGVGGHVSMDFAFGSSLYAFSTGLFHACVIFLLAVLPYVVWQIRQRAIA